MYHWFNDLKIVVTDKFIKYLAWLIIVRWLRWCCCLFEAIGCFIFIFCNPKNLGRFMKYFCMLSKRKVYVCFVRTLHIYTVERICFVFLLLNDENILTFEIDLPTLRLKIHELWLKIQSVRFRIVLVVDCGERRTANIYF